MQIGPAISQNALNAFLVIRIPAIIPIGDWQLHPSGVKTKPDPLDPDSLLYGMKFWIILLMAGMSIGVAIIIARLSGKKWENRNRYVVFFMVLAIIWFFFWLGTQ